MPKVQKITPKHIGIILDGNRRWAKEHGLPTFEGHKTGFEKVKKLLHWCKDMGVEELTLYCFSMQNFKRSPSEVKFLMQIFERAFRDLLQDARIHRDRIKISVIGNPKLLPYKLQKLIKRAIEITKKYGNFKINFAIAYGGREEIVEAVKKIALRINQKLLKIDQINEELLNNFLYLKTCPDLIIRTGGEMRTSNFLVWQAHYSEWFFLRKYWPDFEKSDLQKIIEEYKTRERRFGK